LAFEFGELEVAYRSVFRVDVEDDDAGGAGPYPDAENLIGAKHVAAADRLVGAADFTKELANLAGVAAGVAESTGADEWALVDLVLLGVPSQCDRERGDVAVGEVDSERDGIVGRLVCHNSSSASAWSAARSSAHGSGPSFSIHARTRASSATASLPV
jgi:hypothetical protein